MRFVSQGARGAVWVLAAGLAASLVLGCQGDPAATSDGAGGAAEDLPPGSVPDLSTADQSVAPPPPDLSMEPLVLDLAVADDLEVLLDLAVPVDLVMNDLTQPPDLAPPSIAAGAVIINEVHAANRGGLKDEDNDDSDWIELHNTTNAAVDLTGAALSSAPGRPFQWPFPDGAAIGPRQYLVVFASGKSRSVWGRPLHTSFGLGNGSDRVALTAPGGREIDSFSPAPSPPDVSWCRMPDVVGRFQLCTTPSPRAANAGNAYPAMLDPPTVSVPGGFYPQAQMVELFAAEPGVEIHYTLDGSEPTLMSPLYNAPIPIASRAGAPNKYATVDTTPLNPYITFYAPKDAEVAKATVLRAASFANGKLQSRDNTHTYFIDPNAAMLYAGTPVISLGIDPPQLFGTGQNPRGIEVPGPAAGADNGAYCSSCNWWLDRRVTGSIEYFRTDRTAAFRAGAEFKVAGNWSRTFPQKILDVSFRDSLGTRNVQERIFPFRPYTKFKTFRLRNAGTDWLRAMMRDALVESMARGMPTVHYSEHGRAVLFLDGEYWGQMEIREHTKQEYLEQLFGVDPTAVDIVDVSCFVNGGCDAAQAQEGDLRNFNAWWSYYTSHRAAIAGDYDLLKTLLDPENLAAYLAFELIAFNTDWPSNNNRWWRAREQDAPWHFLLQDLDLTFNSPYRPGQPTANSFGLIGGNTKVATLASVALGNPTFKTLFINTFADLFNTSFSQPVMNARLQAILGEMMPLMAEFYARWRPQNNTVNTWMNEVNVIQDFINRREAGFVPFIQQQYGLGNAARYVLTVNVNDVAMGRVKINTVDLGLEGRLVDVNQPWTGKYFPNVPITATAIAAPGHKFVGWQGASMSNQAQVTLNLNANSSLTAAFAPDPMWMAPVPPKPPAAPPGLRNVALGAPATQSSTNGARPASLAVDGDKSGAAGDASVSLTNNEANAWWQVDLGQVMDVFRVDITNRTDAMIEQLADFTLFVSSADMTGRTYMSLMGDPAVWKLTRKGPGYVEQSRYVQQMGRYVRVQLAATGALGLAEVAVMAVPKMPLVGDPSRLRNLALGAATFASSDGGGAASLAVDGNPDPAAMAKSSAVTRSENTPYWEVDLGANHVVSQVNVYSGTSRPGNFAILLSRQPMAGRTLNDLLQDPNITKYDVASPMGAFLRAPIETTARYVRVERKDVNVALSLAEVVVLGLSEVAP